MGQIISWVTAHWVEICSLLAAIHIIAKVIVEWTPTPKDNEILARIVVFVKKTISIIGLQPGSFKRIG